PLAPPVLFAPAPPVEGAPPAEVPPLPDAAPPVVPPVPMDPPLAPPVAAPPPAPGLPPEPASGPASLHAVSQSERIDRAGTKRESERINDEDSSISCSLGHPIAPCSIRERELFLRTSATAGTRQRASAPIEG